MAGSGAEVTLVRRGPRRTPAAWAQLVADLAPDERVRLDRLQRWEDRQDSAIGWSMLHRLAADHGVVVRRAGNGRPSAEPPLDLSLSHGGGWIAVAASTIGRVGVDVEAHRAVTPSLTRRCLTAVEMEWLDQSPCGSRVDRFLRVWTAKEAYLKATGLGLAVDPRTFSVDCRGDEPQLCGPTGHRWHFSTSAPEAGVRVTVCVEREP